jgi:hypothetical protein
MIAFLYQRSSMATLSLRRGGGATPAATVLMGDRGQACGLHGQYLAIAPASTRMSPPVIISAASEARKTAACP